MNLSRVLVLCAFTAWCASCTQQVCPAYQSYYYHNQGSSDMAFSLFTEDSIPRNDISNFEKNRYGIAKKEPYYLKQLSLHTVEKKHVYGQSIEQDSLILLAELQIEQDSMLSDVISQFGIYNRIDLGYNAEQEYYSYAFGDIFENEENYLNIEGQGVVQEKENEEETTFFQRIFSWWPPFGKNDIIEYEDGDIEEGELPAEDSGQTGEESSGGDDQ